AGFDFRDLGRDDVGSGDQASRRRAVDAFRIIRRSLVRPSGHQANRPNMKRVIMAVGSASLIATLAACKAQAPSTPPPSPAPAVDKAVSDLQSKSARLAPTDLTADITALPANEREALAHMVRAAQVMDALFLEQVWAGNEAMLYTLIKDESPLGKARLHEFLINKGPWARLDHNAVFIPGAPEKPPAANYYPEGATKA